MKITKRKKFLLVLGVPLGILLLVTLVFFLYTADYYRADGTALALLEQGEGITVQGNAMVLRPDTESDTALIFYPGGKVEYTAYLPLLEQLRQSGLTCILVQMPLNYAILDANAAQELMDDFPEIRHWYIGGHSLGGVSAGLFAEKYPESIDGLIALGAYVYGDYPPENALTVYGSLNANLEDSIDYTENIVVIEGGNHAQFGNYGKQAGDLDATITAEEQQTAAAEAIMDFVAKT